MLGSKFTGIGIYTENLIKNLTNLDTQNQYLLFSNQDNPIQIPLPKNFQIIELNCPIYSFTEQIIFPYYLYKANCDLIHFPHFNAPILYLRKHILTIHDLTLHLYPGQKYSKLYQQLSYKLSFFINCLKAKTIITVSKNTEKDLLQLYKSFKHKTQTILLGSHFQEITEAKQKRNYLLYYGNWREHKNIPNLIKAFEIIKKDYLPKIKLILTGKPNPLYPQALQLIKKSKFKKDILMLGHISSQKLQKTIQEAKLVIIPSFYEGFGLQILESLSNKTNVIASNLSSLPEIGQKACLYFNPNDPQEIAHQANKIISSPKLQSSLLNQFQKFKKNYSYKKMAKKTHDIYTKLLSK